MNAVMNIKRTYRNKYWRPIKNIRFGSHVPSDRQVVSLTNFIAKKIKVCPQTTAREAMNLGLVELARIAGIDLGKVLLTDDSGDAGNHSEPSYPADLKSQEKSALKQTAAAV
jgi:hypothetical protein